MTNMSVHHRTPSSAPRRSGQLTWTTFAFLAAILLVGAYFRTLSLFSWDGTSDLHPDERFFTYTAYGLAVPHSFSDYLQSACDANGYVVNPKNASDAPQDQEPTVNSGCNTLNPRNYKWSHMFVYGTLPTTLTRIIAEARHQTNPVDVRNVGRMLSMLFDLASIIVVFFIGWRLFSQRVGLLAALFYAVSVLPIQLAHFFTVDATTGFFTLLAIYWAIRIAQDGGWGSFVALGLSIGAAMACRITLGTLALVGVLAVLVRWLDDGRRTTDDGSEQGSANIISSHPVILSPRHLVSLFAWLVLAGIIAFFTFRVLQPDAFVGSAPGSPLPAGVQPTAINRFFQGKGFFDIRPEPRFIDNLQQVSGFVSGEIDFPPGIQWAARTPFWFSWKNMVLWGMGLPLGLAAWLGWLVAGWRLFRHRALVFLIPWGWIAFYYLWQGGQFVMTMRYYGLMYGLLAVFAAWLLVGIYGMRSAVYAQARRMWFFTYRPSSIVNRLAWVPLVVVIIGTLLWAFAFTRIYTDPHSRIMASRWIYDNVPPGATITYEEWDDALPLAIDGHTSQQYKVIKTTPYAEDDLTKYIGSTDTSGQHVDGLFDELDQADYVVLTSDRVYDSTKRIPSRYPALMRYYHTLFDGELGFKLVADEHSYPRLFGIEISDADLCRGSLQRLRSPARADLPKDARVFSRACPTINYRPGGMGRSVQDFGTPHRQGADGAATH